MDRRVAGGSGAASGQTLGPASPSLATWPRMGNGISTVATSPRAANDALSRRSIGPLALVQYFGSAARFRLSADHLDGRGNGAIASLAGETARRALRWSCNRKLGGCLR